MKWVSLLTSAAILALASTAFADDPVPVVTSGRAYVDFPVSPAGFSSYRGLGFQGSCCERTSPEAVTAWEGYTPDQGCFPRWNLFSGCGLKLGCLTGGSRCCAPAASGCGPCGGPGANMWPTSSCAVPLCYRLQSFHQRVKGWLHGLGCGCAQCGTSAEFSGPEVFSEEQGVIQGPAVPTPAVPMMRKGAAPESALPPPPTTETKRARDVTDPTNRPAGGEKSAMRPFSLLSF